jgi:acetyl-CoA carboxylase biotin carboxyl carrier protein
MIDISLVEKLLDLLSRSDAQTIEIKKRWWTTTIRVSKNSVAPASGPVAYHVTAAPPISSPTPPPPTATPPVAEVAEAATGADTGTGGTLAEIKSPMVGTFYAQPEPGADPYVNAGNRISVGQTLCIIEAMKIMNPLDAEISGVVKEIMVQDAQPVEFGQVLFRVDTNA